MAEPIKDGTGKGFEAKVDEENRLYIRSVSFSPADAASMDGNLFQILIDEIELTSDSESAVFYLKNNEEKDLFLVEQFYLFGASTNGVGTPVMKFYSTGAGGTIISTADSITPVNQRLGDSTSIDVDAFNGAEGLTLTGDVSGTIVTTGLVSDRPAVLPKNQVVAASVTPPPGNTSMKVSISVIYIKNGSDYIR